MLKFNLTTKFILCLVTTLVVSLSISFFIVANREEKLIIKQLENKARVIFKQIVITRQWIADHGGVFIERLPWQKPSPYLESPEIVDIYGKRYLKKTPAMVTKELSKYSKDKELYWFKITSNKLTNPENAPDAFELNALSLFETKKAKELVAVESINGSKYMRYIAPLYVETACMPCHSKQGYTVGEVRGAISVTIPMDSTLAEITQSRHTMLFAGALTVILLATALYYMMRRIVLMPIKRLHTAINDFAEGKYVAGRPLNTHDEFADICQAFQKMASTISQYHEALNNKVKQATHELTETNTRLTEANRLLQELNERKSDFIARASHELRTPLTSIKGAMDYISTKLASNSADPSSIELNRFFELIKKNTDRLIRMVNTMLDIERIELGVMDWNFKTVDITEIVLETTEAMRLDAIQKNIQISVSFDSYYLINADADRLRQTLINLISNAIKFSPPNSQIIIEIKLQGQYVLCEISDSAELISEDDAQKVFEKFYKKSSTGSGLGLAISKSIILAHSGSIGVKKSLKTSGNCFYFKLPKLEQ